MAPARVNGGGPEGVSAPAILALRVMPGMSGAELAAALRLQRPSLKVLYISGYTADALSHHGVPDPGVDLLMKPFPAEALARKLREALDSAAGS